MDNHRGKNVRRTSHPTTDFESVTGSEYEGNLAQNDFSLSNHAGLQKQSELINSTLELKKRTDSSIKRTTLLAGFVPDYIIVDNSKLNTLYAQETIVYFADISGFTNMTEMFSLKGKGGTDLITKTLETYMSPIVECIIRAGGDIIKFAGDAFLAIWKVSNKDKYEEILQKVIDLALSVQENFGTLHVPELNIDIKVKIGLAAGRAYLCTLGIQTYHHWAVFGPAVAGANSAEGNCNSGEVLLHPSAWAHCNPKNYDWKERKVENEDGTYDSYALINEIVKFLSMRTKDRGRHTVANTRKSEYQGAYNLEREKGPTLRSVVIETNKTEFDLKLFVIPPVQRILDDSMPLHYLNETRTVTICFIRIQLVKPIEQYDDDAERLLGICRAGFKEICRLAANYQGCLTKMIIFDKGLTYLVSFGLPGFIHDNMSANALKFCDQLKETLNSIKAVKETSIGVTSGSTYCGILGHEQRQEYTVIGRKVNLAARFMMSYPGKCTCDQDTLHHSKLPGIFFIPLETKTLKGIKDAGQIFEFTIGEGDDIVTVHPEIYPLLNREAERYLFRHHLDTVIQEYHRIKNARAFTEHELARFTKELLSASGTRVIIYEGDTGVGKTRLISACIADAEKLKVLVYSVAMNLTYSSQRNYAIKNLLIQAFGMQEMKSIQEKEDHLRKRAGDTDILNNLCALNDMFGLKFHISQRYNVIDVNARNVFLHNTISALLRLFHWDQMLLFVVDDGHFMDASSWEILLFISRCPNIFVVVSEKKSLTGGTLKNNDAITNLLFHSKVPFKPLRIPPLETSLCKPLACQILQVNAIPHDLEKILIAKSQGNPSWIEQVLFEFVRSNLLKIEPFDCNKKNMVVVDEKYITKLSEKSSSRSSDSHENKTESHRLGLPDVPTEKTRRDSTVALMTETIEAPIPKTRMAVAYDDIRNAAVPDSLQGIYIDIYNQLSPTEQVILKVGSCIGMKFNRELIVDIVPSYRDAARTHQYEKAFGHLFELGHLRCASPVRNRRRRASIHGQGHDAREIVCNCRFKKNELTNFGENHYHSDETSDGSIIEKIRPYQACKFMEFAKEQMGEVVFGLLTSDHKKENALRATIYFETTEVLCPSCGGDEIHYKFGFILKAGEYGMKDTLEELRIIRSDHNRRPKTIKIFEDAVLGMTDELKDKLNGGVENVTGAFHRTFPMRQKTLLDTNKSIPQAIENDILFKMNRGTFNKSSQGNKFFKCFGKRNKENRRMSDLFPPQGYFNEPGENAETPEENRKKSVFDIFKRKKTIVKLSDQVSSIDGSRYGSEMDDREDKPFDLRGCQCAAIKAKISIELVRHYKTAEKYGKCLINLLSAAEASISIGNGSQAIIHLQDAIGLLSALEANELKNPDPKDQYDCPLDQDIWIEVNFLFGLAYYDQGLQHKAKDYLVRTLKTLDLQLSIDGEPTKLPKALRSASFKLWKNHFRRRFKKLNPSKEEEVKKVGCFWNRLNKIKLFKRPEKEIYEEEHWELKFRILSHLHVLYKNEKKNDLALLYALTMAILAEIYSGRFKYIVPAYCLIIEMYVSMGNIEKAIEYEKHSLQIMRGQMNKNEMDPVTIITTANMFSAISSMRLKRGDIVTAIESSALGLRIVKTIHESTISLQIYTTLLSGLLWSYRIPEFVDGLKSLWILAEEERDWATYATYYSLCLDLLLLTVFPVEQFSTCLGFAVNDELNTSDILTKDFDLMFNIGAAIASVYSRFGKWEQAHTWMENCQTYRPKIITFQSVNAELKLLEVQLIFINHYLDAKRFKEFTQYKEHAKETMRSLQKSTKVVPLMKSRLEHLLSYYCRIRSKTDESKRHLDRGMKVAEKHGNLLDIHWMMHSKNVWGEKALPTVRNLWEGAMMGVGFNWHEYENLPPWHGMYSLPLPEWK